MTSEIDLSELFHENTKTRPVPGQGEGGSNDAAFALWLMDGSIKTYTTAPSTPLPPPAETTGLDLAEAIRHRESVREFQPVPIPLELLARMLFLGAGVRTVATIDGFRDYRRNAPSAGNLGSVNLYALALNVEGLPPGVYHYHPVEHRIARVGEAVGPSLLERALLQPSLCTAGAIMILASSLARVRTKYGERGYRYACMEAGHVAQNICLVAVAGGLGACPAGNFCDDEINRITGLDGVDEAAIYLVAVGVGKGVSA